MKEVEIYTDGACSGNPGPGGWGAVLRYRGREKEISGYAADTTNQRMELMAALEALSLLKEACRVRLYSDSAYLVRAFRNIGWKNGTSPAGSTAKGAGGQCGSLARPATGSEPPPNRLDQSEGPRRQ